MRGNRHSLRDSCGRFMAAGGEPGAAGTELDWARGDGVEAWGQIRPRHKKALTKTEILAFLAALAETCNVLHAARAAKRSAAVFYALRARNAAFRQAWNEALREGYDFLEIELVRRARFGVPKDIIYQGAKTGTTRIYDEGTSLRLLQAHRASVERLRADDRANDREEGPGFAVLIAALAARIAEVEKEERGDETA